LNKIVAFVWDNLAFRTLNLYNTTFILVPQAK
jgi:hypothetical protein